MGTLRLGALVTACALGGCTTGPSDVGPLRAEVLAWALIPAQHETFGRIGGLSGACFREVADYHEFDATWSTHQVDAERAALVEFVTDSPDEAKAYHALLTLTTYDGAFELGVTLTHEQHLESFGAVDAEAVARVLVHDDKTHRPGELHVVAYESPPSVVVTEVDPKRRAYARSRRVELPEEIAHARPNRAFESCAIAPDRTLWVATEGALTIDGEQATTGHGTRCLVLRGDAHRLTPAFFYETDPKPLHIGPTPSLHSLSDLEALPDSTLLALERSATFPSGYRASLYRIDGSARTEDDARLPVLNKTLVADLDRLARDAGVPWLGNLEAIALGPNISALTGDDAQRGRLLLCVADDNFGADAQRTGSQLIALRLLGVREAGPEGIEPSLPSPGSGF